MRARHGDADDLGVSAPIANEEHNLQEDHAYAARRAAPTDDSHSDDGRNTLPNTGVLTTEVEPSDVLSSEEHTKAVVESGTAPRDGLARVAARGAVVTLAGQAARVVLQLASVIALARLLTPKDYGLFATVLVVIGIGEIFRDFGLSAAAIRATTVSREQRTKLFWINTMIGLVLTVLVFAAAPLLAALFSQPLLTSIARVLAVTFLLNGMSAQYRAGLNRNLRFKSLALSDIVAQAVGLVAGVLFALNGAGYWSLVAQQLSQVVTVLLMLVLMGKWLPGQYRREVDLSGFLRLGWSLTATQLIHYFQSNVDTFTVGLRFGPVSLGLYNRGYQLLMNPLNQVRTPAATVAIPVLSRLKDDYVRASAYIRKSQITLGYTIVAGLALAAGSAEPLVMVVLGERWAPVAPMFALFSLAGVCQILAFVGYWVYVSRGLGVELFRYTLVSLTIQVICILLGSQWGVIGVAAGFAVAAALEWPLSLWWLARITDYPARELTFGALRILLVVISAGLATKLVTWLMSDAVAVLSLLCSLVAGLVIMVIAGAISARVRADYITVKDFGMKIIRPY